MFGISKVAGTGIAVVAIFAIAAALVLLSIREVRELIHESADRATELADQKWTAKLEKAEAEANRRVAEQVSAAMQIQADLNEKVNTTSQILEETRRKNAALPNGGDVGLSADRVGLLPD